MAGALALGRARREHQGERARILRGSGRSGHDPGRFSRGHHARQRTGGVGGEARRETRRRESGQVHLPAPRVFVQPLPADAPAARQRGEGEDHGQGRERRHDHRDSEDEGGRESRRIAPHRSDVSTGRRP